MKDQKQVKDQDQLLAELYVSTYKHLYNSTLTTIDLYENQYKLYESLIDTHLELEPMKIFKKSHKEWEDELSRLTKCYDDAWGNFIDECKELIEIEELATIS